MKEFEEGGIVTMSNDRSYLIFKTAKTLEGRKYLYLVTTDEPLEMQIAEQVVNGEKYDMRIVTERAEKEVLLQLLKIVLKTA